MDDASFLTKFNNKISSNTKNEFQSWGNCNWNMLFNPEASKKIIEVWFSQKGTKECYPSLIFHSKNFQSAALQKALILDCKPDFYDYLYKPN